MKLAALVFAASATLVAGSAFACPTGEERVDRRVTTDRFIVRNDPPNRNAELFARAAQLEADARNLDVDASQRTARAASLRQAAQALEDIVPTAFGDTRNVILARIDSLLEQAAGETGQARLSRLRATQFRAEANRLRVQAGGGGGGGWRGKRSAPVSSDVVGPGLNI